MSINQKIENIMYIDTKLQVPYISQYLDIKDTINALRSCGMACTYMILKYYNITTPSLNDMVNNAIGNINAFGKNGWIHQYFVDLFNSYKIESYREEAMRDSSVLKVRDSIKEGYPVIISTERVLFDKRIFHMVVIVGVREDENGEVVGLFYHDPASLTYKTGEFCYVPIDTFYLSWRRMAIFSRFKQEL